MFNEVDISYDLTISLYLVIYFFVLYPFFKWIYNDKDCSKLIGVIIVLLYLMGHLFLWIDEFMILGVFIIWLSTIFFKLTTINQVSIVSDNNKD